MFQAFLLGRRCRLPLVEHDLSLITPVTISFPNEVTFQVLELRQQDMNQGRAGGSIHNCYRPLKSRSCCFRVRTVEFSGNIGGPAMPGVTAECRRLHPGCRPSPCHLCRHTGCRSRL